MVKTLMLGRGFIRMMLLAVLIVSCSGGGSPSGDSGKRQKLKVVTTTTMLTDLVRQLAGADVELAGLMGPGVDPHLYKASEGDVSKLFNADIIIYNGLHLEGKMSGLFEKMKEQGKNTLAAAESIPPSNLIPVDASARHYDPHIWFGVSHWKIVAGYVARKLAEADPVHQENYMLNLKKYTKALDDLAGYIREKISRLPESKRVLITAHDAFGYFGKEFGFEVRGLQGISTMSEAGAADVKNLAAFIAQRKIPALFIESLVPHRTIEALQAAVRARGYQVKIGGELFSDALGNPETPEGTYIGMYKYNINTIVDALK